MKDIDRRAEGLPKHPAKKQKQKTAGQKSFFRVMAASIIGILCCAVCLTGMTLAFFSDTISSSGNTIKTSSYAIAVTVTEVSDSSGSAKSGSQGAAAAAAKAPETTTKAPETTTKAPETTTKAPASSAAASSDNSAAEAAPSSETGFQGNSTPAVASLGAAGKVYAVNTGTNDGLLTADDKGTSSFTFESGKKYTVTLTASGTAETGYCKITLGGEVFYTEQLKPGDSVTITVSCTSSSNSAGSFAAGWGTSTEYSEHQENLIGSGKTLSC